MKKLTSVILVIGIMLALTSNTSAVNVISSGFIKVKVGYMVFDPPDKSNTLLQTSINPFADYPPTSYAPSSWYGYNTFHNWSCTYYTYSLYIFNHNMIGDDLDVYGSNSFRVDFYSASGSYLVTVYSSNNAVEVTIDVYDYYFNIINMGMPTPISGQYRVY